jgi:hypothetical protein
MKLSEVYEGWRNHILPPEALKEVITSVSALRMKECSVCEHNSKFHNTIRIDEYCTDCGCTLMAKTKCLSCACPLEVPKWTAVKMDE